MVTHQLGAVQSVRRPGLVPHAWNNLSLENEVHKFLYVSLASRQEAYGALKPLSIFEKECPEL